MFANFQRELGEVIVSGADAFDVLECYENNVTGVYNGKAQRNYVLGQDEDGNDIILQFLYHNIRHAKRFQSKQTRPAKKRFFISKCDGNERFPIRFF